MRAAVLVAPRQLKVMEDRNPPQPEPGEVLVRVTLAGICGTDHSLYEGRFDVPLPVIPGHEGIGVVEKLGSSVSEVAVGQRVAIQPNFPCRTCEVCRSGYENVCPEKVRLGLDVDGVLAQYVKVPAEYTWPIPEDLEDRVAVLTEPLAVAAHAVKLLPPKEGDRLLVLGAGVIGLLTLQLAVLEGANATASDLLAERLSLAERFGAARTFRVREGDELEPSSFDLIYETSGARSGLAEAVRLAAPGGRIALLGLPGEDHPVSAAQIVRKELSVAGSMIYTDEFPQVMDLLRKGKIETGPFTGDVITMNEVDHALQTFNEPDRVKTLVTIG